MLIGCATAVLLANLVEDRQYENRLLAQINEAIPFGFHALGLNFMSCN